ncbi:MrpE1: Na(+)/H(+) antiporter, subunit E (Multiple resistance and pH homeostasis protein E) [Desulfosarcina variabilis str. Montpellier]
MNLRRYFPDPFNFALLLVVWLLLTHRFTVGNLLLAAILAWLIPLGVSRIRTTTTPVRKPIRLFAFLGVLVGDIVVSNIVVAKQVLGVPERLQPGFVAIPLDLKEALPITILASTISLTPGTVSIEITKDRKTLYVHALHVESETELVDRIKYRYEKPLKEIFGC